MDKWLFVEEKNKNNPLARKYISITLETSITFIDFNAVITF